MDVGMEWNSVLVIRHSRECLTLKVMRVYILSLKETSRPE